LSGVVASKGALDFHISLERGQHNDASLREFLADGDHYVDAAQVGKLAGEHREAHERKSPCRARRM